mmetsp:Transcript_12631/g.1897  ORF Transcript_12631/g.1897 Transcript_12631/m.1897 type:complete len:106 (-) Transcript_12631:84-401(-)
MELCTGPDLQTYVYKNGPIPEEKLIIIIYKLLSAISYLHSLNICHRDIKPENLMFCSESEDSEFKLVDFGMSAKYAEGSMLSAVGTPYFIAPEVVTRRYGKQCDI